MKKIVLFMSLIMMSANMLAEEKTATLQQGSNMKAFFGEDAFKQAYEAAKDGAVITLSKGTFNPVESIEKSISIIGYNGFDSSSTNIANMKILADNVKIEGLWFVGNVELGKISNCYIKRCTLRGKLVSTETHTNTFIDQSVVISDYAIGTGVNYVIKNSTISSFKGMNTFDNKAQITNCVIRNYVSDDLSLTQPYAIYMNNVLGIRMYGKKTHSVNEDSEFYYNYFVKSESYTNDFTILFPTGCVNQGNSTSYNDYDISYPADGINWDDKKGMDGTVVGINGGSGFEKYPSIPRITSSSIDDHTDSQGKINVKISAKVGSN